MSNIIAFILIGIAVLYVYWAVVAAKEGKHFQFSVFVVWTVYVMMLVFKRLMEI